MYFKLHGIIHKTSICSIFEVWNKLYVISFQSQDILSRHRQQSGFLGYLNFYLVNRAFLPTFRKNFIKGRDMTKFGSFLLVASSLLSFSLKTHDEMTFRTAK